MPHGSAPTTGHDDEFFWAGVAAGKLLARRCARCRKLQHPPSPMCPRCGSLEWDIYELDGRGTLHSWILAHHPTQPDGVGRIVALVLLVEGIRMVANLRDVDPADVHNDMALKVAFMDVGGVQLPQFRPSPVDDT